MTAPLSPNKDAAGPSEQTLYWEHERSDPVLNVVGDAIYLWDRRGGVCSAFASCDDGKAKRYSPSRTETQHNAYYNLVSGLGGAVPRVAESPWAPLRLYP